MDTLVTFESPRGQKLAVTSAVAADSDWNDCYASGPIASALIYIAVHVYADTREGGGDRGELVSALEFWKAISDMRRGRR